MSDAMDVVRRLFRAVERRDRDAVMACYAEDVEIHEAAVLPYGGTWRGLSGALAHAQGFRAAWDPYQGPDEIRLDPHFWGDASDTVCVLPSPCRRPETRNSIRRTGNWRLPGQGREGGALADVPRGLHRGRPVLDRRRSRALHRR